MRAQLVILASIVAGVAVAGPAELTATVAALVVAALVAAQLAGRVRLQGPARVDDLPLRHRERRQEVVRLCDPDAAGRPRPRAPTA